MNTAILKHLWQVGGPGLTSPNDAAAYLVRFGSRAVLIDTGCGQDDGLLIDNIKSCLPAEVQLDYLLLTHCHFDHSGGAEAVRQAFGCAIAAHALDAVYLESGDSRVTAAAWYGTRMQPLQVDIRFEGDEKEFEVDSGKIRALHWPGHSPGSVVYTARIENQLVLFGQDVHGPLHPTLLSDRTLYEKSLEMLLALDADLLLEGHFGIIRGRGAVKAFIASYLSAAAGR